MSRLTVILAMILMHSQATAFLATGVTDYVYSVMSSLFNALGGAGYLIGGIHWKEIPHGGLTNYYDWDLSYAKIWPY